MQWKRCVKSKSVVADRRTWESKCGRYQVMQSHIPLAFGKRDKKGKHLGYSDRYYAMHFVGVWEIISKHTKRKPAERACDEHEKRNSGKHPRTGQGRGRGNRVGAVLKPGAVRGAKRKSV